MVPRTDGRTYELEPIVNVDNCMSCGICAGSCPTSTPFRRAKPIEPGIELPHRGIGALRDELMAPFDGFGDGPRVVVFACDQSNAKRLEDDGAKVIKLPCIGMLPPSFVDFALSRGFADGVMLSGCAEGDCYHRLGNEWTIRRMARERDPYLRKRVQSERLELNWLPSDAARRRSTALAEFKTSLRDLADE
jgi:coenzyme F420-reducing hydrogenase delta subunit